MISVSFSFIFLSLVLLVRAKKVSDICLSLTLVSSAILLCGLELTENSIPFLVSSYFLLQFFILLSLFLADLVRKSPRDIEEIS